MGRYPKETRMHARRLFVDGNMTAKDIAINLKLDEKTVGRWRSEENWDDQRVSYTMTKTNQIQLMMNQLKELNTAIESKPEGQRFASSREADVQIKITKAIRQLETETSISDVVEVSKKLILWLKDADPDEARRVAQLFDRFIRTLA